MRHAPVVPPHPVQHLGVFHQGFLAETAWHMKHIQRWRIGQRRIRRQP
jgi:hypothetical protein